MVQQRRPPAFGIGGSSRTDTAYENQKLKSGSDPIKSEKALTRRVVGYRQPSAQQ
jgi:hypothetical protein